MVADETIPALRNSEELGSNSSENIAFSLISPLDQPKTYALLKVKSLDTTSVIEIFDRNPEKKFAA